MVAMVRTGLAPTLASSLLKLPESELKPSVLFASMD